MWTESSNSSTNIDSSATSAPSEGTPPPVPVPPTLLLPMRRTGDSTESGSKSSS